MAKSLLRTALCIAGDLLRLGLSGLRSHGQLAAENLFLRKQLALYMERQVKPRRADDATRIPLVALAQVTTWRHLLTVVKPETLIRWHRQGFRLFWRWKSTSRGRPRVPPDLQQLIGDMARANRSWGEERIASELLLKLRIRVSPRTVRRYMPPRVAPGGGRPAQRNDGRPNGSCKSGRPHALPLNATVLTMLQAQYNQRIPDCPYAFAHATGRSTDPTDVVYTYGIYH